MKRLLSIFLLWLALCSTSQVCWSQDATPQLWRKASPTFKTENDFRYLAKRYANTSRMSYYLILRAFSMGKPMTKNTVLTYYALYRKYPNNVRVQASFAFAHYIATDYRFERGVKKDDDLDRLSGVAASLRTRSVAAMPKDSTILLMAARPTYFMNMMGIKENLPDMEKGIRWAKQSIKYDSQWAESYYWLSFMLQYFAMNHPVTATKNTDREIWNQSIAPAKSALYLGGQWGDKATQVGSWYQLAQGYKFTQKQLSLFYLDKYTAAIPPSWRERQKESTAIWRQSLIDDIRKSRGGKR